MMTVMPKNAWADQEPDVACMVAQHAENARSRQSRRRVRPRRSSARCESTVAKCEAGQEPNTKAAYDDNNTTYNLLAGCGMDVETEASSRSKVYSYNGTFPAVQGQNDMTSGSPVVLSENQELCNHVMLRLEEGDSVERLTLLLWFHKESRRLSLSKSGCRLVQKALEVTGGTDRDLIIAELKDHVQELYASPNGNYVLSRAIEVLPASKIGWVISAVVGQGLVVSKHKFGCRVICRLIEHCTGANEEQIGALLDEILEDAPTLARHTYGNFVMQTMFEHTSSVRRKAILQRLLPEFSGLAMHRTGSLVAQRALTYCEAQDQDQALLALLSAEGETSLTEVACSHYGAFVIEQVSSLRQSRYAQEIKDVLANDLQRLATSQHSQGTTQQVAIAFGLATGEQLEQIAQLAEIACQ